MTVTFKGQEAIADSLVSLARAQLPGILAEIAAERGDGVPLQAPTAYFPVLTLQVADPVAFWAEVPHFGQPGNYLQTSPLGGYADLRFSFSIGIRVSGDDEVQLGRQGYRYTLALWELLARYNRLSNDVPGIVAVNISEGGKDIFKGLGGQHALTMFVGLNGEIGVEQAPY